MVVRIHASATSSAAGPSRSLSAPTCCSTGNVASPAFAGAATAAEIGVAEGRDDHGHDRYRHAGTARQHRRHARPRRLGTDERARLPAARHPHRGQRGRRQPHPTRSTPVIAAPTSALTEKNESTGSRPGARRARPDPSYNVPDTATPGGTTRSPSTDRAATKAAPWLNRHPDGPALGRASAVITTHNPQARHPASTRDTHHGLRGPSSISSICRVLAAPLAVSGSPPLARVRPAASPAGGPRTRHRGALPAGTPLGPPPSTRRGAERDVRRDERGARIARQARRRGQLAADDGL